MNSAKLSHKRRFIVTTITISLLASLTITTNLIREVTSQTTHEVEIISFAFVPQNLTISAGDTVKWNNTDGVIHTLWFVFISNRSTYLLSDPIPPNTTWTHTFNTTPELQYYSFDKLWITGFINVQAGVHDVAVTNVTSAKSVICQGCVGNVRVTVENQGDFAETFNVTAYANTTAFGETTVALPPLTSTDIVFQLNATGFSKGNYTLKAEADNVPGETDTADNTYIDGWVIISMIGDITGPTGYPDGECDMRDISLISRHFGQTVPPGCVKCDLTGPTLGVPDGFIDMRDISLVARHFGQTDP